MLSLKDFTDTVPKATLLLAEIYNGNIMKYHEMSPGDKLSSPNWIAKMLR
jgi:hypothetical protein